MAPTKLASRRLRGTRMYAPAHLDAEILSALGRLTRANNITTAQAELGVDRLAAMPVHRHNLHELLGGAWARRADLRLADGLYVKPATQLRVPLLTSEHKLARVCSIAESVH